MLLPAKTTRRKFYNKWFYKTTLRIPGSSVLRIFNHDELRSTLIADIKPKYFDISEFRKKAWNNKEQIISIIDFLSQYNKSEYFTRLERDTVDFYTNNIDFYNQINLKFSNDIIHRFEPNEITKSELDDSSIMVVKKLPKNRYGYRVYLKPHMFKGDSDSKTKYLEFLERTGDSISISDAVKRWFIQTDWNWDRRYILVDNEKTLLLLKLRNPEIVGRVYRFVVR